MENNGIYEKGKVQIVVNSGAKLNVRNAVKFFLPPSNIPIVDDGKKKALLYTICERVPARGILAASVVNDIFSVYFSNIEYARIFIQSGITFAGKRIPAFPLCTVFTVGNVPPTVADEEIGQFCTRYGNVVEVETLPFLSNDALFSHIGGSDRRVFLELAPKDVALATSITGPITSIHGTVVLKLNITEHCIYCETDGHLAHLCDIQNVKNELPTPSTSVASDNVSLTCSPGPEKEDSNEDDEIVIPSSAFQYISSNSEANPFSTSENCMKPDPDKTTDSADSPVPSSKKSMPPSTGSSKRKGKRVVPDSDSDEPNTKMTKT